MEYAEIENSSDEVLEMNKKKRDFKIELALFFALGFLLGFTFKTEAVKKITIGYEDYKLDAAKSSYDVFEIRQALMEKAKKDQEDSAAQEENSQAGNNGEMNAQEENQQ